MTSLLRILLIACLICLSACGQDYNSNSQDGVLADLGLDCGGTGQRLCNAALVFVNNKCYQCHGSWSAYNSNAKWLGSGLVKQANPSGSRLIQKLINAGGNMPLGGGAISGADYATLQTWILNL